MPPSLFTSSVSTARAGSPRRSTGGGGGGLFGITCGCKDSKAASVPGSSPATSCSYTTTSGTNSSSTSRTTKLCSGRTAKPDSLAAIITTPTPSSSGANTPVLGPLRPLADDIGDEDRRRSSCSTPSFSGLLRQLADLEKNVRAWDNRRRRRNRPQAPSEAPLQTGTTECRGGFCRGDNHVNGRTTPVQRSGSGSILHRAATPSRRHWRWTSEGGGHVADVEAAVGKGNNKSGGAVAAVVKETADPVGDFRRSMLSVIAEEGIETEEGLRTLLGRFLAINPPENHPLALRAFALVWDDIFSSGSGRYDDCFTCEIPAGGDNYCDQIQYQYQYYYQ